MSPSIHLFRMSAMIVVGDETGLVKLVDVDSGETKTYGIQDRERAPIALFNGDQEGLWCARKNGSLEHWSLDESERLLTMSAEVKVCEVSPSCVGQVESGFVFCETDGQCHYVANVLDNPTTNTFQTQSPISTCRGSSLLSSSFILGGKERELFLYDVSSESTTWEAKNVAHDKLNLRVPVWITAVDVLDANTFVIGTAYKHVRVYDIRESRRPVRQFELDDGYRVSALRLSEDNNIAIGDTSGNQFLYDVNSLKKIRAYKGATGSIRGLEYSAIDSTLVSGGLDRNLRVYNISSSNAIRTIYMKNRVNCVLPVGTVSGSATNSDDSDSQMSDFDDL